MQMPQFDTNLMRHVDVGGMVRQGIEQGKADKKQREIAEAMRALAANPDDPNGNALLIQADPERAMQWQQHRQRTAAEALQQYQGGIKTAAEVIQRVKAANPNMPDAQVYSIARQTLIQMRVPGAEKSPEQFDQRYFDGIRYLADPEKQSQGQIVPFTQGGGVARLNPQTGQVEVLVMPNDGSHPAGAPVQGAVPPPPLGFVLDNDGGPAPQAPGGFPEPYYPDPLAPL